IKFHDKVTCVAGCSAHMEKTQATRIGVLAALAFALLMACSYFMSTVQPPHFMVVRFPSGAQITLEVAERTFRFHAGLGCRASVARREGLAPGADWRFTLKL